MRQDCSVGKVDVVVLEGEEEIIVYAYVDIDDGNSKWHEQVGLQQQGYLW